MRRPLVFLALAAADLTVLVTLPPHVGELGPRLAAPHRWIAEQGADEVSRTLGCAALWCAAVWLALGLLAMAATALPGVSGRLARRVAGMVLPAVLYRTIAGAAGVSVLLAPVAAAALPAGARSAGAAPLPAPVWPTERALPPPAWPANTGPVHRPMPSTARPSSSAARHERPDSVVVQPGDSLWAIAARQLGAQPSPAQIAEAWPAWYVANRQTIGADPDVIQVGTVLHGPAGERS